MEGGEGARVRAWGGAGAGGAAAAELGRAARRAGALVGRLTAAGGPEPGPRGDSGGQPGSPWRFRARPWALVSPGLLAQAGGDGAELLVVSAPGGAAGASAASPGPGATPRAAAAALLPSQELVLLFEEANFRALGLPGRREPGAPGIFRVSVSVGGPGFCEGSRAFDRAAEALGRLPEMDFVCSFCVAGVPRDPLLPPGCSDTAACALRTTPAGVPPVAAVGAVAAAVCALAPRTGGTPSEEGGLPEAVSALRLATGALMAPPGVCFDQDFLEDLEAPEEASSGPATGPRLLTEGMMAPAFVEAAAAAACAGLRDGEEWVCLAGWGERHAALLRGDSAAGLPREGPWSFCLVASSDAAVLITEPPG